MEQQFNHDTPESELRKKASRKEWLIMMEEKDIGGENFPSLITFSITMNVNRMPVRIFFYLPA